jgi:WD40 repeat protein
VAFDASGRRFLSAGADGSCRVYDTASGTLLHVLAGHTGEISKACFNPQGSRAITAGADKTCRWAPHAAAAQCSTAGSCVEAWCTYSACISCKARCGAPMGPTALIASIVYTHSQPPG